MRWTTEEKETATRLYRQRVPVGEIARILGKTFKQVMSWLSDNGVSQPKPVWTKAEILRLEELRMQGLKLGEIAVALGRTRRAVSRRVSMLRIGKFHPRICQQLEVFSRGVSLVEAAGLLGLKNVNVARMARHRLRKAGCLDHADREAI